MKRYIIVAVVWGFLGLLVCCLGCLNEDAFLEENFPDQWKQFQAVRSKAYNTIWQQAPQSADERGRPLDFKVWELEVQLKSKIAFPVFLLALMQHGADYAFWGTAFGVVCQWIWNESCAAQELARQSIKSAWFNAD